MPEPFNFDVKVIGLFVTVLGGIILILKRLGFKLTAESKIMPVAQVTYERPELSSKETVKNVEKLWEKKQEVSHCELRVSSFQKEIAEMKEAQREQGKLLNSHSITLAAIAEAVDAKVE